MMMMMMRLMMKHVAFHVPSDDDEADDEELAEILRNKQARAARAKAAMCRRSWIQS